MSPACSSKPARACSEMTKIHEAMVARRVRKPTISITAKTPCSANKPRITAGSPVPMCRL